MSGQISTRGVGYTKHLDETLRQGVYESPIPNWNFLYVTPTTTKSLDYNIGNRVILPDGRVFRYGRATNIVRNTMQGLKFFGQEVGDGIGYKAPLAQVVGDEYIKVSESGVTLDELRGGMVIFHTHTEYADFTRGIVGNDATDSSGYVKIYLDAALHIAVTTSFGVETCPNPYRFLSYRSAAVAGGPGGDAYSSVAGIPTRKTTAANQYVWIQTWGPCWINPQGSIGYTVIASRRLLWFTDEGSIICVNSAGDDTAMRQIAGFLLTAEDASGTGPPLVMLTITP